MRSSFRLSDSQLGLVLASLLGLAVYWVMQVSAEHAKEHGHDLPGPLTGVEAPEREQADARREGQDSAHGSHAAHVMEPGA